MDGDNRRHLQHDLKEAYRGPVEMGSAYVRWIQDEQWDAVLNFVLQWGREPRCASLDLMAVAAARDTHRRNSLWSALYGRLDDICGGVLTPGFLPVFVKHLIDAARPLLLHEVDTIAVNMPPSATLEIAEVLVANGCIPSRAACQRVKERIRGMPLPFKERYAEYDAQFAALRGDGEDEPAGE